MYASVFDFVCIALFLPFVLGICLSIFLFLCFFRFFSYLKKLFFFIFFILITFFSFLFLSLLLSFFLFILPFILSHVEDRLSVLQSGVRAVPLRWESQVQDAGPQETSQLHVISNGKNLPEISISTPRPSSTQQPASYSARHPMPNN